MFTTIINDCKDDNARSRQESRVSALLETATSFIGVNSDLEAGMHLLDILDATEGRPGIILLNVAPRGGHATKWENGTPFAFFWYHQTLIVGSVDGYTFSGAKKVGILPDLELLDTHTGAAAMQEAGFIDATAAKHIPATQFRSFDFTPRIAAFLWHEHYVPSTSYAANEVADLPLAVWHIDSFGNAKTTLLPTDLESLDHPTSTRFGDLLYTPQLRDLPDHTNGLVRGSSGLSDQRFLELIEQRGNFSAAQHVEIGDAIFNTTNYAQSATGN